MMSDNVTITEERDALAAVVDAIRHNWRTQKPELFHGVTKQIIDRAPSDVLAERDARIRAEVIDWVEQNLAGEDSPAWARSASRSMISMPAAMDVVDSAREHFGLTKGAHRG